jgi:hypothetical protein
MTVTADGLEILGERECLRLLERSRVGRVAIVRDGLATVVPVTYAVVGDEIAFFTGEGMKLDAARNAEQVSFEVDHIDLEQQAGWSVLVVGVATLAGPAIRNRAEALGLYPWAAGDRPHLVRIRPGVISGRRVLTGREPESRTGDGGR